MSIDVHALAHQLIDLAERSARIDDSWSFQRLSHERRLELMGISHETDAACFDPSISKPWRFRISADGSSGIVARVSESEIDVRLASIAWNGPHTPYATSRPFRRIAVAGLTTLALATVLEEAFAARRAQFRRCPYCGDLVAPEHTVEEGACHGCAERHLGVVF